MTDPVAADPDPVEVGAIYEDSRTDEQLTLIYCDENVVLLRDSEGYHRLNRRNDFDKNVEHGRYSHQGRTDAEETVPFEDLDNIGEKAANNLREAGFETIGDVRAASDEELLDVSWVGEAGVESIREYVDR